MRLNELSKKAYIQAHKNGFYDHAILDPDVSTILLKLLLINGEVAEAVEVLHKSQGSERLHEELADIMIRLLDLMGYVQMDVESVVEKKMEYNSTRPYRHGKAF
jgi:NTP pyrophosphatase (non-canonical NTP hydrolase)